MKWRIVLALFYGIFVNAEEDMNRRDIFLNFTNFYEAIHPAEENSRDAYVWFSSIPHPFLNVVIHLSAKDVEAKVDQILQKNVRNNPMTFWLHPENDVMGLEDALRERNFKLLVACPAMTWEVHAVPAYETDIRNVEHIDERATFYDIVSTAYQCEHVKLECSKLLESGRIRDSSFRIGGAYKRESASLSIAVKARGPGSL